MGRLIITNLIKIKTKSGKYLVVDYSDDDFKDLCISLESDKGDWIQDLAIVREKYEFKENESGEHTVEQIKGVYEVLVYADKDSEDYTHKFDIDELEDE